MKMVLFATAMMLGSAAVAQTGNTVDDPSQGSGPRGVTQQGTDPEGQACTPPGYNAGASSYPVCGADTAPAAGTRPPCSKTVTDGCVQTYERGRRR